MVAVFVCKVNAEGKTAFPRNVQRFFRNAELRCHVVFVSAADCTVNGENPRLNLTCFLNDLSKLNILAVALRDPARVEPENIQLTVILTELQNLIFCIFFKTVPHVGIFLRIVGRSAGCQTIFSQIFIPVVRAVPVGFGKISTDADAFCTECIKHGFYDIRIFMFMERAVLCSCFIICIFGIPEAESVVMLCGQKKITESAVLCHLRPFLRLKADRIKRTIQAEILFFEGFAVRPVYLVAGPVGILVT